LCKLEGREKKIAKPEEAKLEGKLLPCPICFITHKDGTKIKAKHDIAVQKIRKGALPCDLGLGCLPWLCIRYKQIIENGLKQYGNCNHLLAELNRTDHFLKELG